jgi:hypothetical protein
LKIITLLTIQSSISQFEFLFEQLFTIKLFQCFHIQMVVVEAASFLGQTTSYKTEVQERKPWFFYEWITCNEKPRCAPNIFPGMKNTGVSQPR